MGLQERTIKAAQTCQEGTWIDPSLLRALARTYGLRYAALGILKLVDDILNFAGKFLPACMSQIAEFCLQVQCLHARLVGPAPACDLD